MEKNISEIEITRSLFESNLKYELNDKEQTKLALSSL